MADEDQVVPATPATNYQQSPLAPGFLRGWSNVLGNRILEAHEDERAQRNMERQHFWQVMHDPALGLQPGDTPEVVADKQRKLQFATEEFAKRAPKSFKPALQYLTPILQKIHGHDQAAQTPTGVTGTQAGVGQGSTPPPSASTASTSPTPGGGPPPPPSSRVSATPVTAGPPPSPPAPTGADLAATSQRHQLAVAKQAEADKLAAGLASREQEQRELPGIELGQLTEISKMPEEFQFPAQIKAGYFPKGAFGRMQAGGGGVAKDLRAQGYDVPQNIPDEQWVNMKESYFGPPLFVPGVPPSGQYTVTSGGIRPKYEAGMEQWRAKNQIQFGHQLTLQAQRLQNALTSTDYTQARKIVNEGKQNYFTAQRRADIMDKNLQDIKDAAAQGQTNQQAMVSLLGNHVLMTTGAGEKGATRATRAMWEEAKQSQPWLERVKASFDSNGYLSGVTLGPDQMQFMVDLAHERLGVMKDNVDNLNTSFQADLAARKRGPTPPPTPGQGAPSGRRVIDLTK